MSTARIDVGLRAALSADLLSSAPALDTTVAFGGFSRLKPPSGTTRLTHGDCARSAVVSGAEHTAVLKAW